MITSILIDDEIPALAVLEHYLCLSGEFSVLGKYTDPSEGIKAVENMKPQTVFLDIDMPEIKGTEAAALITEKSPDTVIIFITAFSEYALMAYELSALDYIMKPVSKERLEKAVPRIKKIVAARPTGEKRKLKIRCLGGFSINREGAAPIKWRSRKVQEVIALLVQNRGKIISSEVITDTIWPELDYKNGAHLLRNSIYHIRKALMEYGVTEEEISIQDRYSLTLGDVELDADDFERRCGRLKCEKELEKYTECMDRYTGEYFAGFGWLWAEQKRAELSRMYLRTVSKASELLIKRHEYAAAEERLLSGLHEEPYGEDMILRLLELYKQTGEYAKAARLYNNYSETMAKELGCSPSEEITTKFLGAG